MREGGLDRLARIAARMMDVASVRILVDAGGAVRLQGAFGPHPGDCAYRVDVPLGLAGRRVGTFTLCDGRARDGADRDDLDDLVALAGAEIERVALAALAEDLRDQERRLRVLLAATPLGVLLVHPDGSLTWGNPAGRHLLEAHGGAAELTALFPGLSTHRPPFDLRRSDDPADDERPPLVTTMLAPDGSGAAVEVTVAGLRHDDATDGARWLVLVRQLAASAEAAGALDRQRRLTQLVLDSAGDGLVGIDTEGIVIFANIAARRMLRRRDTDLLGHRFHDVAHPTHADGTPMPWEDCPLRPLLLEGSAGHLRDEAYTRRDGSRFPVDVTVAPIVEDGRVVGAVTSFRDMTEARAMDQLQQEFIAVVSHELRTPLTSIKASLGLLTAGVMGPVPAEQQDLLRMAAANSDRLGRLVDDILDLERLDAGRMPLRPEPVDAADLVRRAVAGIAAGADAAGVEVVVHPPDGRLEVDVDPHRMVQVLTNLLGNAVKFSEPGSRVTVGVESADGTVRIAVADQGRGIPADQLDRVFERFRQVEAGDARRGGGTGLGLPIARELVDRSGGSIEVTSEFGRGSTFTVVLPSMSREDE